MVVVCTGGQIGAICRLRAGGVPDAGLAGGDSGRARSVYRGEQVRARAGFGMSGKLFWGTKRVDRLDIECRECKG
jgi:hypothetical protein